MTARLTHADLQHATIVAKLQASRAKATPEPAGPVPTLPADPAQAPVSMAELIHHAIHKGDDE